MERYQGECFLVPGPVRLAQSTLSAMATPTMTARGTEYRDVMAELNSLLRMTFNLSPSPSQRGKESWTGEDGYKIIVVSGSGTAAMEMVMANRFSKDEKVLVPTNGKFGERVALLGDVFAEVTHLKGEWGEAFDLDVIDEILARGEHTALAFCHNETSSGITQDAEALSLIAAKHGVSLILDGITSVGGLPVHPKKWKAEAVVVGAQKCTAGPSGIAAIAVSEDFIERVKARRSKPTANPVYYLDILPALKKGGDDQTPWTPAINLAIGWVAALRILDEETLAGRWQRCEKMAAGVRSLFSSIGLELFADKEQLSSTVTAILYPEGINDQWRAALMEKYSTQVIGAQDHMKGKMFRVGSMGETPIPEMIEGCKRMIECFIDFGMEIENIDVEAHFE